MHNTNSKIFDRLSVFLCNGWQMGGKCHHWIFYVTLEHASSLYYIKRNNCPQGVGPGIGLTRPPLPAKVSGWFCYEFWQLILLFIFLTIQTSTTYYGLKWLLLSPLLLHFYHLYITYNHLYHLQNRFQLILLVLWYGSGNINLSLF